MTYPRRKTQHAAQQMTREYNRTMALSKIDTAPLATLTDQMVQSITNSHSNLRERPKMLAELQARIAARRAREGHGG